MYTSFLCSGSGDGNANKDALDTFNKKSWEERKLNGEWKAAPCKQLQINPHDRQNNG